jgi:nucleoside-diphosphate-sugar epimerase
MSWDAEEKPAEASKGANAARCRVPVRAHTHVDPAPLAVAESADGARGGRDMVRAAKDVGGVRRVVVTSSISAMVPSPGGPRRGPR